MSDLHFRYSASLRVRGNGLDFDSITANLGLLPTHVCRPGKRPPSDEDQYGELWAYAPPVAESRPLGDHLRALWGAVGSRAAYIRSLATSAKVDVFCLYESNSDTAGFKIPWDALRICVELGVPLLVSVEIV